jgi:hypothetical protein
MTIISAVAAWPDQHQTGEEPRVLEGVCRRALSGYDAVVPDESPSKTDARDE